MENKKETAVEWLELVIKHCKTYNTNIEQKDIDMAKKMEKEQIINAYNQGIWDSPMERKDDAEQYYELVYGNK